MLEIKPWCSQTAAISRHPFHPTSNCCIFPIYHVLFQDTPPLILKNTLGYNEVNEYTLGYLERISVGQLYISWNFVIFCFYVLAGEVRPARRRSINLITLIRHCKKVVYDRTIIFNGEIFCCIWQDIEICSKFSHFKEIKKQDYFTKENMVLYILMNITKFRGIALFLKMFDLRGTTKQADRCEAAGKTLSLCLYINCTIP